MAFLFSGGINRVDLRRILAGLAFLAVQSLTGLNQTLDHGLHQVLVSFEHAAHRGQGLPKTFLHDVAFFAGLATLFLFAFGQGDFGGFHQGLKRREKAGAAERMAGAVGPFAFDAVFPALGGAVHNGRRLAVFHFGRPALSGQDLLKIHALRNVDDIPVVHVSQLCGGPLHVIPGRFTFPADLIRVDGSLVPVDVENRVLQGRCPGGSQGFAHAPRREPAFSFHNVHARRPGPIIVQGAVSEAKGTGKTHSRCPCGKTNKRGGRGGMTIQGF